VSKSVLKGHTKHIILRFCTFIVTTATNEKISINQVVGSSDLEMAEASTFIIIVCNSKTWKTL